MPNKNYIRGRVKEYEAIKMLQDSGFTCIRASGSHGLFDLIGWNENEVRFIQCKREKKRTALKEFNIDSEYKEDAEHIRGTFVPSQASREMWIWVDRLGWSRWALRQTNNTSWMWVELGKNA
jgi:hypothetical protein